MNVASALLGFASLIIFANDLDRPQLSASEAAHYSYTEVLKYTGPIGHEVADPWDPLHDAEDTGKVAAHDIEVDGDIAVQEVGHYRTVQGAIDYALSQAEFWAKGGQRRIVIRIRPGIYEGLVYIPQATLPITLIGTGKQAADTVIRADLDASVSGAVYAARFGKQFADVLPAIRSMFDAVRQHSAIDTVGSAVTWIRNQGFQAQHLTFENAYNKVTGDAAGECPATGCKSMLIDGEMRTIHHQAVAVMVDGADRVAFEDVRFLGFQDTLYLKSANPAVTSRSFFDRVYIEGDVDYIFGDSTAYFYRSEIRSLGDRTTSYVVAPATNVRARFGFVFDACSFTNDGSRNALKGRFYLGRQWFHNQRCTPYSPVTHVTDYRCSVGERDAYVSPLGTISKGTLESVGKTVILHSFIGNHINRDHPWSDWNSRGTLAFRPAQFRTADFIRNLIEAGIDPDHALHYAEDPPPDDVFLGEFENSGMY